MMKKERRYILAGMLSMLAGFFFVLWKAPYGFASMDECFYLALAKRLSQGDRLLIDEWFLTQPFGILLVPLMKMYLIVHKNAEGMVLAFRYMYVVLHTIAAAFVAGRLWKKYGAWSFGAAFLLLIYTPFNIMSFSYNGMAITLLILCGVIIMTLPEGRVRRNLWLVVAGLFLAGAVLCCPYLLAVYILYLLGCIIYAVWKKKSGYMKDFLAFTAGAAILAAIVLVSIVTATEFSVDNLKTSLAYIFTNPTHGSAGIWEIKIYFETLFNSKGLMLATVLWVLCIFVCKVVLKRIGNRVAIPLTLLYSVLFYFANQPHVNYCVMPLSIVGLAAFIFAKKKDYGAFWFLYIPGVLYSFCISFSSNQKGVNIYSVMILGSVAAVLFLGNLYSEWKMEDSKAEHIILIISVIAAMGLCFGRTMYYRATHAFWELDGVGSLTAKVESGVQKGLWTTPEKKQEIESLEAEAKAVQTYEGQYVCYIDTTHASMFLLGDAKRNSSYATYYEGDEAYKMALLNGYLGIHPERKADIFWLEAGCTPELWIQVFHLEAYEREETPLGNTILRHR